MERLGSLGVRGLGSVQAAGDEASRFGEGGRGAGWRRVGWLCTSSNSQSFLSTTKVLFFGLDRLWTEVEGDAN